jgi:hypothetical protein
MSYSADMTAMALPLHLGGLHPMESLLMGGLALAPFVILAVVVTVVSRRDRRAEREERTERAVDRPTGRVTGRAGEAGGAQPQATRDEPSERDTNTARSTDTAAPQSVQQ